MKNDASPNLSRDERREQTEATILAAARSLFARVGFERTTIRAVASRARVDPALVMHHFGSKERLFAAAAQWRTAASPLADATRETLADACLQDLLATFDQGPNRGAALALMRASLTHPTAMRLMRDDAMSSRRDTVAAAIDAPDADLRAALVGACMMGLSIARYLMEFEPVASAPADDIGRLMRPALEALLHGDP